MPRMTYISLATALIAGGLFAPMALQAKDRGPINANCDSFEKATPAWRACAENTPAAAGPAVADSQHFYAGYWLAKNGRYEEALHHLQKTTIKNARVLTYIGFATRKLGNIDEAMGYYDEALRKDPDNLIARSYLGEAHLVRDDLTAAISELDKIKAGCGTSCEAYTELAAHISEYRTTTGKRS